MNMIDKWNRIIFLELIWFMFVHNSNKMFAPLVFSSQERPDNVLDDDEKNFLSVQIVPI